MVCGQQDNSVVCAWCWDCAFQGSGKEDDPDISKNALLGSLVLLATFVTLCNAQCFLIPRTYVPGDLSKDCTDVNGVKHPLKSNWKTEDCNECSCGLNGIQCCNYVATPVSYDIKKCKKIFDKENCKFNVVERKNPEQPCFATNWVV